MDEVDVGGTPVTRDALRQSVAGARSWRGVARALGLTGPGVAAVLRRSADEWDIDARHFGAPDEARLRSVVEGASTWLQVLTDLGHPRSSGSARAVVRRQARAAGISTSHLDDRRPAGGASVVDDLVKTRPDAARLRRAAPYLVAAACELRGYGVSWPLEPLAYDLVVDAGADGLQRVQVKTATSRQDGGWQAWITRSGRAPYAREEIDCFGVVDGDAQVYLIPVELVEGQQGLRLRRYEAYRVATVIDGPDADVQDVSG